MPSPQRIRRLYKRGKLRDDEVFTLLMQTAEEAELAEFVACLPAGLLEQVEVHVKYCPRTEEGWARWDPFSVTGSTNRSVYRRAVEVLRDLIAPQPRPSLAPAVLAWNDGCVVKLARGISEERAFDRMPILGDALEEGGCESEDVLRHCREQTNHVRGCWVLSLLAGKVGGTA
jgi:hypothetical protein